MMTRRIASGLIVFAMLFILIAPFLAGCDGATATGPVSGKPVSAPELLAEVNKANADAVAKAAEESRKDREDARKAQAKATADAIKATAKQDIAAAEVKAELARIAAESQITLQGVTERASDRQAALDQFLKSLNTQADAAFGEIAAKESQRNALLNLVANNPIVKSGAATFGIDTGQVSQTLFGGAAAYAIAAWRGRKKEDAAYDAGKSDAHKDRDRADAAFDEGVVRTTLLNMPPPVKAAA